MTPSHNPLIIVGASARAAAQSAIRGGYQPWCVDLFADRDLQAIATCKQCPGDQYPHGLLKIVANAPLPAGTAVLYTGGLENAPEVIDALAFHHPIMGCSPQAVRAVRRPKALASLPSKRGRRVCKAYRRRPLASLLAPKWAGPYLVKPYRGTGGVGIRHWTDRSRLDRDHYLQQYITGTPIGAAYVGDGWSARLLGATEQLIGDTAFGVDGFRYCGSIGPMSLSRRQRDALAHLGVSLAQRFDLRGPFGVDAVIDKRGRLWPVEVNPRYTASIEVLERARGVVAISPNTAGESEGVRHTTKPAHAGLFAKAIVFARQDVTIGDLYDWFDAEQIADVPQVGQSIRKGRPICTLFAAGPDRQTCLNRLHQQAQTLYTRLGVD